MLQDERLKVMMEHLRLHKIVKVPELVELTHVSIDTVRRDLEVLESRGMLRRVHGGAIFEGEDTRRNLFQNRQIKNKKEKIELATFVTDWIEEGKAIALNSGTTNIEVARKIGEKFDRLTVITNSLKIVDVLTEKKNFTIILPGGVVNNKEYSINGSQCEKDILQYNIDIAIITVNALSLEKGLTDFRLDEVGVIRSMMSSADKTILALDSSKFETVSFINVCSLAEIDLIVTDTQVDRHLVEKYKAQDIQVMNTHVSI